MLIYSGITDVGLKREVNEDSYLMEKDIFIISDGMGGHDRGEIASKIIIDTMKEEINIFNDNGSTALLVEKEENHEEKLKQQITYLLNSSVIKSKKNIEKYIKNKNIYSKMGATIAGIYFDQILNKKLTTFHLGDSRVYMIRKEKIEQLTIDHSMYEDMRRSNRYREEDLKNVNRNVITKAIGNFKLNDVEVNFYDIEDDDIYIICSDGVSDLCNEVEILDLVLKDIENLDKVCENIKKLVYLKGARDNLSFIIIRNITKL